MVNGNTEKLMNNVSQMSTQELIDAMAPEPDAGDVLEPDVAGASEAEAEQVPAVEQPGTEEESVDQDATTTDAGQVAEAVEEDPTKTAEAAEPAPQKQTSHDRAIVKAARAAEARANKELARLRREIEDLRAKQAPAVEAEKKPRAEVLEDVKQYAPEAGQYIEVLERQVEELKQAVPKPVAAEPEFTPDVLHPDPDVAAEIQADLDEVPEISTWHVDPDQTNWTRAKAIDAMLVGSPRWAGKPMQERLKEVVRLRKEEMSAGNEEPSTTPTKPVTKPTAEDARRVIEAKAKAAPVSASDIRGRSPPTRMASKRDSWHSKTNEQLLAELPEIPE